MPTCAPGPKSPLTAWWPQKGLEVIPVSAEAGKRFSTGKYSVWKPSEGPVARCPALTDRPWSRATPAVWASDPASNRRRRPGATRALSEQESSVLNAQGKAGHAEEPGPCWGQAGGYAGCQGSAMAPCSPSPSCRIVIAWVTETGHTWLKPGVVPRGKSCSGELQELDSVTA
jgi:hypothetical protein